MLTLRAITTIRATLLCASVFAAAVLIIVSTNRVAILHSENASLSLHALGYGETEALARAQYEQSWKFARSFLAHNHLYKKKIRMTGVSLRRVQDRMSRVMSYIMERRIDIYGKDWDEFLRYHNSIGPNQPSTSLVVADLPRTLPTYGDLFIVVTVALAAICAGPLQFTRSDDYPAGMHPVSIFLHVTLIPLAAVSIWDALDQPHPSLALFGFIAVGTVLVIGRWLVTTKTEWATVLGLGGVPA